jgi:hypothetical protein
MEILVQSVQEKAAWLESVVHVRYWEKRAQSVVSPHNGKDFEGASLEKGTGRMVSYVIVRRSHSYLEPVIRELFGDAEDVRVLPDRRWHERRQVPHPVPEDRRILPERRISVPMLDVLIGVAS